MSKSDGGTAEAAQGGAARSKSGARTNGQSAKAKAEADPATVTVEQFLEAIFGDIGAGENIVVTEKTADDKWRNERWPSQQADEMLSRSGYVCISSVNDAAYGAKVKGGFAYWRRRKVDLVWTYCIVLDDIGTKIPRDRVKLEPPWELETSKGNFQFGYLIGGGCEPAAAAALVNRLTGAGLSDPGMKGAYRVCRVPGSLHRTKKWRARLTAWRPALRYTVEEIERGLELPPESAGTHGEEQAGAWAADDPRLELLQRLGMVRGDRREDGGYNIRCPWIDEHTGKDGGSESETTYWPETRQGALGTQADKPAGFHCFHGHCEGRTIRNLDSFLVSQDPHVALDQGVALTDFVAYMPQKNAFIFMPTSQIWPGENINARLPPIMVGKHSVLPAAWIRRRRPVEQMTWMPGAPMVIVDKLLVESLGWIDRRGARVYNQFKPAIVEPGDPAKAGPWVDLVRRVYPDHHEHVFNYLAHLVQRPGEKINHALVTAGKPGIGKDTILEPVKRAVGLWNAHTIKPQMLLGRFTGFARSVLLHISEARALPDADRSDFYNRLKDFAAAPPMTHRMDEKNIKEYFIPNVGGVVITTNYRTDWIFLPSDDRRLLVLWSLLTQEDFGGTAAEREAFWTAIYHWYEHGGGYGHVAAWLRHYDLEEFNAKAPPPKTPAFWELVNASRPEESSQLDDVLDLMGRPAVTTIAAVIRKVDAEILAGGKLDARRSVLEATKTWLGDKKERPKLRHRFADAGYHPIQNPSETQGRWRIKGYRQVVYGRDGVAQKDLLRHAQQLTRA